LTLHAIAEIKKVVRVLSKATLEHRDAISGWGRVVETQHERLADLHRSHTELATLHDTARSLSEYTASLETRCTEAECRNTEQLGLLETENAALRQKIAELESGSDAANRLSQLNYGEANERLFTIEARFAELESKGNETPASAVAILTEQTQGVWAAVEELRQQAAEHQTTASGAIAKATASLHAKISDIWQQVSDLQAKSAGGMVYKGVWKEGEWPAGSAVTYSGSIWIARRDTSGRPGDGEDNGWQLACKAGRNGRGVFDVWKAQGGQGDEKAFLASLRGKDGAPGPTGPPGHNATTLHLSGKSS
jgi:hypothetical protein